MRRLHDPGDVHAVVWRGERDLHLDVPDHQRPNASACPGSSLAFAPTLAAGVSNINAGGFSPLSTTISRPDDQQDIQGVTVNTPPGFSGMLTGIPLCPQAQAQAGTCGLASRIGQTTVSVGLGGDPYTVTGGEVFLTEGYEGAPFGLSIVNPAVAGPLTSAKSSSARKSRSTPPPPR